jgi:hypothetical protein
VTPNVSISTIVRFAIAALRSVPLPAATMRPALMTAILSQSASASNM